MDTTKSKTPLLIGLGILAIIVVTYILFTQMNGKEENALQSNPQANPTATPSQPTTNQTQTVVFKGTSPCADCPGISVTLTLNYDGATQTEGSYKEESIYQEKNVDPLMETGTWKGLPNNVIELTPAGSNSQKQYFLQTQPDTLEALDQNQQKMPPPANYTLTAGQ